MNMRINEFNSFIGFCKCRVRADYEIWKFLNGQFRDRTFRRYAVLKENSNLKLSTISAFNWNQLVVFNKFFINKKKVKMVAQQLAAVFSKLQTLSTSDHASVVSMNLFVALLCACIVIGHLLEENRWMNESITALLIVSFSLDIFRHGFTLLWTIQLSFVYFDYMFHLSDIFDLIDFIGRVFVLGLLFCWRVGVKAHIF